MTRTILDDLAALPPDRRARLEAAFADMERTAFLQGYIAAHFALALWQWRFGRFPWLD